MKNPVRYLILMSVIFAVLIVNGCATQAKYRKVVDSWVGKSSKELVRTWGYPKWQITAPNKNIVYVYEKSRMLTFTQNYYTPEYGGEYGAYGGSSNTQSEKLVCTIWFEIDRYNNKIAKVLFKGDLCVAGGMGGDHPKAPPESN